MAPFILYLSFIPTLVIILLVINFVLAIRFRYKEKMTPFECGIHSFLAQNRTQFTISFFIFGLLFLLFDLEILLAFPYAVSHYVNSIYGLILIVIFLAVLTLGFVFELGKKALKFDIKFYKMLLNDDITMQTSSLLRVGLLMKVIITLIIIIKRYFPIFVKCIHYLFIFIALITFLLSVLFLTLIIYVDSLQAIMNMDPIDYVFNKIAELKRPITFNYDSDTYCSSSEVASSSSESASGSNIPNADLPRTRTDLVGGALIEGSVPISDMTHNIVLPSRPNDPIAVSGNFDATQLLEHTEPLSTEDKRSFFTQILGKLDEQRQQ